MSPRTSGTLSLRKARSRSLPAGLLALSAVLVACSSTGTPRPVSEVSFVPAAPSSVSAQATVRSDSAARARAFVRALRVAQPVTQYLEGPALVVSLGGRLVELRADPQGKLPRVPLEWGGCAPECTAWTTDSLAQAFAEDLISPESSLGSERVVGPDARVDDPRGNTLAQLPALVVYRATEGKWRTWYVVFDSTGARVVALVAEAGSLL